MLKVNKKNILSAIFFLFIVGATFYLLLKDQELPMICDSIESANVLFLLLGIGSVVFFVCCESVIIHYLMKKLHSPLRLRSCIKYSFIGFFFSCITPSATGGQPAQLYYMKKDKADLGVAALVLLEITVVYKSILIFLGVLILTAKRNFVIHYLGKNIWFLYFGIIVNVVVVVWLSLMIFYTSSIQKLTTKGINFLASRRIIKSKERALKKTKEVFSQYNRGADFLKKNTKVMLVVFLITFVQRISMFLVTYFVYCAFSLKGYSVLDIVALQSIISIAVDMLPIPGGVGASENLFLLIFRRIFGGALVMPGMLLSRAISYYGLLIISAIITLAVQIRYGFRKPTITQSRRKQEEY